MDIGKIGVWAVLESMTVNETLEFARTIEKRGYRALWIPEGSGRDPFSHAAYLLSHSERLSVATGIANVWARDAVAMASKFMSLYIPSLPNYVNNRRALGYSDADFQNGCSDRLVDAIVAWGTEGKIRERIQAHLAAGATHVCIQALRPDSPASLSPDLRAIEVLAPGN